MPTRRPGRDLDVLIDAAIEVSATLGCTPPPPPWLPPLPEQLAAPTCRATRTPGSPAWGLIDLPAPAINDRCSSTCAPAARP